MRQAAGTSIPITLQEIEGGGCHILCYLYIGNKKVRALIDTGASHSMVHVGLSGFLVLSNEAPADNKAVGFGDNAISIEVAEIPILKIGRLQIENQKVGITDLKHIMSLYEQLGIEPFEFIIGSDLLNRYGTVINYFSKKMRLKTEITK